MRIGRPFPKILLLIALVALASVAGGTYAAFSSSTGTTTQNFSAAASFGCTAGSQTVTANLDTYVDQNDPANSFDTNTALVVRTWKAGPNSRNARTLVRFPLPTLPSGCTVSSATLTLTTTTGTAGRTLQAFRATAAWSDTTTWTTQPATTGTAATTASAASGAVSFNVTTQTQALYAGTNNGFLVRDSVEDAGNIAQTFASSEAASGQPTLAVSWN